MSTPLERQLFKMSSYKEYERLLDTPGLAFEFNEFVKKSFTLEKLVLDYFDYRDEMKKKRDLKRKK